MKLPNVEKASIRQEKLTEYLLNLTHPDGWGKAKFFIQCGFSPKSPDQLKNALLNHALLNEVTEEKTNPFGVKYVIKGEINAPDGTNPAILSVWIIENEVEIPELITAYPA